MSESWAASFPFHGCKSHCRRVAPWSLLRPAVAGAQHCGQYPRHGFPVRRADLRQFRGRRRHPDAQRPGACAFGSRTFRCRTRAGDFARSRRFPGPLRRARRRLRQYGDERGDLCCVVGNGRQRAAQHRGARHPRPVAIGTHRFTQIIPPAHAGRARRAADGHAIAASRDGKSFAIVFGAGPHSSQSSSMRRRCCRRPASAKRLLTTLSGEVVALGSQWRALPNVEALSLGNQVETARVVEVADGRRLVALHRVADWPLAVGLFARRRSAGCLVRRAAALFPADLRTGAGGRRLGRHLRAGIRAPRAHRRS